MIYAAFCKTASFTPSYRLPLILLAKLDQQEFDATPRRRGVVTTATLLPSPWEVMTGWLSFTFSRYSITIFVLDKTKPCIVRR